MPSSDEQKYARDSVHNIHKFSLTGENYVATRQTENRHEGTSCRMMSLKTSTPAMEAGITDHVWSLEEMCALLPKGSNAAAKAEKKLVLTSLGE